MRQLSSPAIGPIVDAATMQWAEMQMWMLEIKKRGATWREKFIAAERICEIMGVDRALRAVSSNGLLRLPPPWPLVDVVPVGGGPGFITTAVRSMIGGIRREVNVRIARTDGKPYAAAIEEAVAVGKFKLAAMRSNA